MNIFVVEDESWALAELAELFKKYETEHNVYTFSNGDDALAAAKHTRPHLLVTDITMPGISGLELIRCFIQIDPFIKCLILSVHDQFEYARQGLKMGVVDYLLKPVKKDVLYQAVDKMIAMIEAEEREREERMTWSIARALLSSSDVDEDMLCRLQTRPYFLIYFLYRNWNSEEGRSKSKWNWSRLKSFMQDTSFLHHSFDGVEVIGIDLDLQRRLLLIPAIEEHKQSVLMKLRNLYEEMSKEDTIHIGYALKRENDELYDTFELLHDRMEHHVKFGQSTWIEPDVHPPDIDLADLWDKVKRIPQFIQQGQFHLARDMNNCIVDELKKRGITTRQLVQFASNFYYALNYKLQENLDMGVDIKEADEDFRMIRSFYQFDQFQGWTERLLYRLYETYGPADVAPKNLIPRVIQWIHQNYAEPITLQKFANDHHISLSYLSREFKAQTGETFTEYLMRYRVEKAKDLLAEGIGRIGEVASMVGYEDPKHFRLLFRKLVGMSPQKYQKQVSKHPPRIVK